MTLTEEILQGNESAVRQLLASGADVNELDIYGYTPLIEAAIANNKDIAELLISYEADVNKKDLVGGTALHWAVENYNLPLCELLLKQGADPNAYFDYGQPVLVQPLLRRQHDLKELLYRYGANLKFAQDYINTKLISHRFELVGRVYILDAVEKFIEIDFEGFILEFTISIIQDSLISFRNNFAARNLRSHFKEFDQIIAAFQIASELIKYQQYMVDIAQHQDRIAKLVSRELILMPMGYEGHAITFVRYRNLFAKCDRGENSRRNPSVMIYHMANKAAFNTDFIKHLLYKKQKSWFVTEGIVKALDLTQIADLPLPSQLTGNCSWANVEAVIPTMLYMFWLEKNLQLTAVDNKRYQDSAMAIYKQWQEWDKDWALHQCVESFYDANPARKASKAALLAAVLFQTCHYTVPGDLQRANKILAVLAEHDYQYVLDSYLKVYKNTQAGRNLLELIDLYSK